MEILRCRCAVNVLSPLPAILQHDSAAHQQSDDDGNEEVRDDPMRFAREIEPTASYASANGVIGHCDAQCGRARLSTGVLRGKDLHLEGLTLHSL